MKYDELISRVEMFEKLAVYGNRSEFLKSIGQSNTLPENLLFSLSKVAELLNAMPLDLKREGKGYLADRVNQFVSAKTGDPKTIELTMDQVIVFLRKINQAYLSTFAQNAKAAAAQLSAQAPTAAAPAGTAVKPVAKPGKPQYWGTKEQMALIQDVQRFLEMSLGKESLSPYGADGKWGNKSKAALSQWLSSAGGSGGDGTLNTEALRQLARYIPSVQKYYSTLPESKKPDPYNPEPLVSEPVDAIPAGGVTTR